MTIHDTSELSRGLGYVYFIVWLPYTKMITGILHYWWRSREWILSRELACSVTVDLNEFFFFTLDFYEDSSSLLMFSFSCKKVFAAQIWISKTCQSSLERKKKFHIYIWNFPLGNSLVQYLIFKHVPFMECSNLCYLWSYKVERIRKFRPWGLMAVNYVYLKSDYFAFLFMIFHDLLIFLSFQFFHPKKNTRTFNTSFVSLLNEWVFDK